LFVGVAVENQLSAIGVQSDLEYTGAIAAKVRIGEGIAVGLKSCIHENVPVVWLQLRLLMT
jgi:hypothetical protein